MGDQARVLVVDDNVGVREYLDVLLTRLGYIVSAVANETEAVDSLDREPSDVITLDLVIPGTDGLEVLSRLRNRWPTVPVVMLSGHGQARSIVEAMKRGAADFLRKPFESHELETALTNALRARAEGHVCASCGGTRHPPVIA